MISAVHLEGLEIATGTALHWRAGIDGTDCSPPTTKWQSIPSFRSFATRNQSSANRKLQEVSEQDFGDQDKEVASIERQIPQIHGLNRRYEFYAGVIFQYPRFKTTTCLTPS